MKNTLGICKQFLIENGWKKDNEDGEMKKLIRWPSIDEVDGETKQLIYIIHNGWDWSWPGWEWVARRLNEEFNNNRSANSCRLKYKKYLKSIELRGHRK